MSEMHHDPDGVDESDPVLAGRELEAVLESILLVVDTPVDEETLASVTGVGRRTIATTLRAMASGFDDRRSGIDLRYAADGWRFYTRNEHAPYVERLLLDGARSKLTRAALETLAVVAYRQPLTRARVSAVRGVNVDGVMRTLLARGLIAEAGSDPETNATTYVTTEMFLERLGLASLADLPPLAPLLPDVDLIDEISEGIEDEPRFAKLNNRGSAAKNRGVDIGPGQTDMDVDE